MTRRGLSDSLGYVTIALCLLEVFMMWGSLAIISHSQETLLNSRRVFLINVIDNGWLIGFGSVLAGIACAIAEPRRLTVLLATTALGAFVVCGLLELV